MTKYEIAILELQDVRSGSHGKIDYEILIIYYSERK